MDDTPVFAASRNPLPPFRDKRFRVEIMTQDITAVDHEAVMSSRASLRLWSDSDWPEDDFTVAQNADDLQLHIDDHAARTAYAYTVLSLDGKTCYGSIYIKPVEVIALYWEMNPSIEQALRSCVARVDFWLRDSEVAMGGDAALTQAICRWMREHWHGEPVFASREGMRARRIAYQEAGVKEVAVLKSLTQPLTLHLHARL